MSNLKLRALAGVCALMSASALAAAANAQATGSSSTINGAGSSLLAPYWAEATHCFDSANTFPSTTSEGEYYVKGTPVVLTATAAQTCTPTQSGLDAVNFDSTGSGSGIGAVFAHSEFNSDGTVNSTYRGNLITLLGTNPDGSGNPAYTAVQYGLSDNSLVASDVSVYNNGGTEQGVTVAAPGASNVPAINSTTSPNPAFTYGALVQFPVSIDPVALAYNPVYKSSNGNTYSLNVQSPNSDGSGGLKLNAAAYCGIFTGAITDWGSSALTALNGGVSLKATADTGTSAPIIIVGRSDSSGTTSIFTRHLAAVCGSADYTTGTTTLPTAVASLYTLASGSGGVATAIHNNPGAIGYIGPDYALPAVINTGATTYALNVADLEITSGGFIEPSGPAALASFGSVLPPQTTTTGAYSASMTANGLRNDPTAWVQSTAATAPLATPPAGDYPIVGTTNFLGYTCYASASALTDLKGFLSFGGGATAKSILSNAGLSQLPPIWLQAISTTFVAPTSATSPLNLFFAQAGTGSTNSTCTGVTGG